MFGLPCFLFLQVSLPAGQAIYLAANEPHAYISGELVECMASSDNVIRAGLTPKFRDTAVLCDSLTYNTGLPEVLNGTAIHDHVKVFRPPFEEFEIQLVEIPAGETVSVPVNPGPILLLVQGGKGSAKAAGGQSTGPELKTEVDMHRGNVVFVPANTQLTYSASAEGALKVWVAACNAKVFAPTAVPVEEAVAEPVMVTA
jgi:mannose-6-phosphate isomerase